MKEYGVIFSGPMVRAVLAGSKTQTRRAVKIRVSVDEIIWNPKNVVVRYPVGDFYTPLQIEAYRFYPRWHVGDRIWMKETCYITRVGDDDGAPLEIPPVIYAADGAKKSECYPFVRAAMFMPQWASRFTGDVLRTWIERLQDISEADAVAEGFDSIAAFAEFWDSKSGKKPGLSRADNPWILGTEFRGVK